MQHIFQMRYSFFGKSGWQSETSKDKQKLFDDERLRGRAYYLENIALAGLRGQTNPNFRLAVLTSSDLPSPHKKNLIEMCNDMLGANRVDIIEKPTGRPARHFIKHMRHHTQNDTYASQIVLDDDDALSIDFVDMIERESAAIVNRFESATAEDILGAGEAYCYLSQATGVIASFKESNLSLYNIRSSLLNLGLTLIAPRTSALSPFNTAHKKIWKRHPVRIIYEQKPYYLRVLHDHNDSIGRYPNAPVTEEQLPAILKRFPLLEPLLYNSTSPHKSTFIDA